MSVRVRRDADLFSALVFVGEEVTVIFQCGVNFAFDGGLGYSDDAAVMMAAMAAARRYITADHRARARAFIDSLTESEGPDA